MNKNKTKLPFKQRLKNHFKNNKRDIIINYIALFSFFFVLLAIDLIVKQVFYKPGEIILEHSPKLINLKIISFGSYLHVGTTVFDEKIPFVVLHIFSILALVFTMIIALFVKNKYYLPAVCSLAVISAGAFGNMIDRMVFGGVRDVLLVLWGKGWLPQGIFNFADLCLAFGAIFTAIYIAFVTIYQIFKDRKDTKNKLDNTDNTQQNTEKDTQNIENIQN